MSPDEADTASLSRASARNETLHWHGHELPPAASRDPTDRADRPPEQVLTSALEAAEWVEERVRAVLGADPDDDWSDSRAAWFELLAAGESITTGTALQAVAVDAVEGSCCPRRRRHSRRGLSGQDVTTLKPDLAAR